MLVLGLMESLDGNLIGLMMAIIILEMQVIIG
jgi:hypothetical protein